MLRDYSVPGPVATCELAFALAARLKYDLNESFTGQIAVQLIGGVERYLQDVFKSECTAETTAFYTDLYYDGDEDVPSAWPLSKVFPKRIEYYLEHGWYPQQLASMLGQTLCVSGYPAVEASFIFTDATADLKKLLKNVKVTPNAPEAVAPPAPARSSGASHDIPPIKAVVEQIYQITKLNGNNVPYFTRMISSVIGSPELSEYDAHFKWIVELASSYENLDELMDFIRMGLPRRLLYM